MLWTKKNVEIPHVVDVKMSNFKIKKIYQKKNIKTAQNRRCTYSMCQNSVGKF